MRAGQLGPGTRLPSTRTLAADLNVSRNTVSLAYEQLVAEGYVVAHVRSMMAVAHSAPVRALPPAARPKISARPLLSAYGRRLTADPAMPPAGSYASRPGLRYDFRYGRPVIDEFPREIWRRLIAARARHGALDTFGYGPPAGYGPLREALAGYLWRARGMSCDAERIVIVNGSQQAFDLVARVLLDPGDKIVIEEPHYQGSRLVFEAAGARPIGVTVDAEGLDTTRLPPAAARIRLASVTPCHQFPTGVIMPLGRRLALLDWASRAKAWVVEDDYVSEFRYEGRPIEALQALDRSGRVIYIGTFSKTLFPALRLAYLVLPPALVRPVVAAKWMADRYTAMLGQEALTDFITTGRFERYLRRASTRNAARRRALIEALKLHLGDRVEIAGENAGVHLLVWLNDIRSRDIGSIIARAAGVGVGVYSIHPYYSRPPRRAGLIFGYASLTEAEIRAGIRRFAQII
ncbi:MAG: PLP-dependent aminotransferase family protein [Proteobacteria bacterium]|nr:PLP-dependent aminotransferase family protein [Pseudomonadota bacterium]